MGVGGYCLNSTLTPPPPAINPKSARLKLKHYGQKLTFPNSDAKLRFDINTPLEKVQGISIWFMLFF